MHACVCVGGVSLLVLRVGGMDPFDLEAPCSPTTTPTPSMQPLIHPPPSTTGAEVQAR